MAEEHPAVSVSIGEFPDSIQAGETLELPVSVENQGSAGTDTIELEDFNGETVSSEEVELEAAETANVTFEWEPAATAIGSGQLTVRTSSTEVTTEFTVEEAPAYFEIAIETEFEHVPEGDTIEFEITIENTGTLEGTQTIDISVDDDVVQSTELTLAGGESETIQFESEETVQPEYSIEVASKDEQNSLSVPVVTVSVTPMRPSGSKSGMGIFGWLMFIGMIILLIPLLPIFVAIKLIDLLFGGDSVVR